MRTPSLPRSVASRSLKEIIMIIMESHIVRYIIMPSVAPSVLSVRSLLLVSGCGQTRLFIVT